MEAEDAENSSSSNKKKNNNNNKKDKKNKGPKQEPHKREILRVTSYELVGDSIVFIATERTSKKELLFVVFPTLEQMIGDVVILNSDESLAFMRDPVIYSSDVAPYNSISICTAYEYYFFKKTFLINELGMIIPLNHIIVHLGMGDYLYGVDVHENCLVQLRSMYTSFDREASLPLPDHELWIAGNSSRIMQWNKSTNLLGVITKERLSIYDTNFTVCFSFLLKLVLTSQ